MGSKKKKTVVNARERDIGILKSTHKPTKVAPPPRDSTFGAFQTEQTEQEKAIRTERESTKRAKQIFLDIFARTMGTITVACEKADIGRGTYYLWLENDPKFKEAIIRIQGNRLDMAEDRLFKLIQADDGPSVRYFLDRQHPRYKPTSKMEVVTGDETFEDLLYEQALKRKAAEEAAQKEHGNTDTTTDITTG